MHVTVLRSHNKRFVHTVHLTCFCILRKFWTSSLMPSKILTAVIHATQSTESRLYYGGGWRDCHKNTGKGVVHSRLHAYMHIIDLSSNRAQVNDMCPVPYAHRTLRCQGCSTPHSISLSSCISVGLSNCSAPHSN